MQRRLQVWGQRLSKVLNGRDYYGAEGSNTSHITRLVYPTTVLHQGRSANLVTLPRHPRQHRLQCITAALRLLPVLSPCHFCSFVITSSSFTPSRPLPFSSLFMSHPSYPRYPCSLNITVSSSTTPFLFFRPSFTLLLFPHRHLSTLFLFLI